MMGPKGPKVLKDDGGRREEIEAAPVMGWPLDSCHSERSEESRCMARMTSLEFMQGPGTSPLPADWDSLVS